MTVKHVARYVTETMRAYYTQDASESSFSDALMEAAMQAHEEILKHAEDDPDRRGMATTLTLWLGVWPWVYLLQVGDSRYYILRDGYLTQITRDQTMAEELIAQGVMTRTDATQTRWAHVLSSSIGGRQTAPVVTRLDSDWKNTHLLCSDGLTKHVSDDRIRERLVSMTSAKQVCEDLLQDALDDGGTDNITIVVGRTVQRDD